MSRVLRYKEVLFQLVSSSEAGFYKCIHQVHDIIQFLTSWIRVGVLLSFRNSFLELNMRNRSEVCMHRCILYIHNGNSFSLSSGSYGLGAYMWKKRHDDEERRNIKYQKGVQVCCSTVVFLVFIHPPTFPLLAAPLLLLLDRPSWCFISNSVLDL